MTEPLSKLYAYVAVADSFMHLCWLIKIRPQLKAHTTTIGRLKTLRQAAHA